MSPKTGRSAGTDTDPPYSSPTPPAAQPLLPPFRVPIVPPLLVLPQINHPSGPPSAPRNGPPPARASNAPVPPVAIAPRGKARFDQDPNLPDYSRRTKEWQAEAAQNALRARAAFGVRPLAGAVEERHPTRGPTTPLLPSTKDRTGCSPDDIAQWRAGFHPRPMATIPWRARFHPGQGTRWKASFHRMRWNSSLQPRTAWKPSLQYSPPL